MRAFFIIFLKELRAFFLSPLAWTVMALFTFLNAWLFASMINAMQMRVSSRSLIYNFFDSGWFWMGFFILFPLITHQLALLTTLCVSSITQEGTRVTRYCGVWR